MSIAICCILLIPPHAFYYDGGLLLFPWIMLLSHDWKYKLETFAGVWILGFSQFAAGWLGFSPVFPVIVFTFVMAVWKSSISIVAPIK